MPYNGFIFFYDWRSSFRHMKPKECQQMILAMLDYSEFGTEPPSFDGEKYSPVAKVSADVIFKSMERSRIKSECGKKGAEARYNGKESDDLPTGVPIAVPITKTRQEKTRQEETRQDNSSLFSSPSSPSLRGKKVTKEKSSVTKTTRKNEFTPPSVDDVLNYCIESGVRIDAEYFVDYYSANGWRVGKNKMRDWKAAVRNWERKNDIIKKSKSMPQDEFIAFMQQEST